MKGKIYSIISEQDLILIEKAVSDAELKTSGEIVPYLVEASDSYPEVFWKITSFTQLFLFLIGALLAEHFGEDFHPTIFELITGTLIISIIFGLLLSRVSFIIRWVAGKEKMADEVQKRAAAAFVSEEVFLTKDRTGILIFVSHLEHMVWVIGDSGIHAKVKQEEWQQIVNDIIHGMKNGQPANGLIQAIIGCGNLLQQAGFTRSSDDTNELGNKLRGF